MECIFKDMYERLGNEEIFFFEKKIMFEGNKGRVGL